jgi:signal peptidase I
MHLDARRRAIVWIAIVAAALMTLLLLVSAVVRNPVIALPQAMLTGFATIGLWRGDRWAGFGLALFLTSCTAGAVYSTLRFGLLEDPALLIAAIVPLAIAAFGYLAGQALERSGPRWPWIGAAAVPASLALFFNLMFLPTGSMEPTLLSGDTLVVKRTASSTLKAGDLVVYREPGKHNVWVKRVVGVGGDRIHLDHKMLYRNGRRVEEPYAIHTTRYIDSYRDSFPSGDFHFPLSVSMQQLLQRQVRDGDFVVPEGTYFVLGDNRDNSLDSRYSGVIPVSAVIGKPLLVCFSASVPTEPAPRNVLAAARWRRVLMLL